MSKNEPSYEAEAALIQKEAGQLQRAVTGLYVTDDHSLKEASELLSRVKSVTKDLKAKKKGILDPLAKAVKNVKELFKGPEDVLAATENVLKDAMLAYHEQKDAAARKEAERIQARMEKGTLKVGTGIAKLANIDMADTKVGGAQFKQSAEKVRITDPKQLIAVRPELLQRERVLEALRMEVAADIRAGAPCPQGVELYREKVIAAS